MALRITLEPGKKIIVNGAVIENTGGSATLKIHNKANILRGTEVLKQLRENPPSPHLKIMMLSGRISGDEMERDGPRGVVSDDSL